MIPYFLFCRRKFKTFKQVCQLGRLIPIHSFICWRLASNISYALGFGVDARLLNIRIITIRCGHTVYAPVPSLLVLHSLSDSAPLLSSMSIPCTSWLYVFSCCFALLCSFSLFFIVSEGLLITSEYMHNL